MKQLIESIDLLRSKGAVSAGTTDIEDATPVDMAGFDGVLFVAVLGDITNTSVITLKAEQDAAVGGSYEAIEGSATFTAGASDADDKFLVLDVARPAKQFVRPIVTIAEANAEIDAIIAIPYHSRSEPVSHSSDVLDSAKVVTPAVAA